MIEHNWKTRTPKPQTKRMIKVIVFSLIEIKLERILMEC